MWESGILNVGVWNLECGNPIGKIRRLEVRKVRIGLNRGRVSAHGAIFFTVESY